ncbi:MAG TPA: Crp/Fnr family transcriptional regulator [Candidatus Acidoferrum sp.]|nr:Crp/Fnr family transcriptional regulator [Candidatus Acidoferrum sp.]
MQRICVTWLTFEGNSEAAEAAEDGSMGTKSTGRTESIVEAAALSAVDLFKNLPGDCLRGIEKKSTVREFKAGHVFFRPGESGEVLFLLEKGRVQTFRELRKRKLILTELKPPAVFGEMGCIGQGMYHCSAETMEASRIRMISREKLEQLLEKYPEVTRRMLELVSERFVHVLRDLEAVSFRQLIPRLANLLLEKSEGNLVRGLTHRELAQLLGVYRESATAALGELRSAGIVSVERKRIRILERMRLERAAQE